ncbi:MAG TPA: DUF4097 family beta strand repeat-containing protein [Thermoanaerobaculia bacterium]|jgi:DUF4097 and DUF4098 domain-containing protein YvlB
MRRTLMAALLLSGAVTAGAEEQVFEKAYSLEGITRVSVENVNGRIDAVAWDKNYVRVRAVKKATGSDAEETLNATEIRVRKEDGEITIETVSPKRRKLFGIFDFGERHAQVDYEIKVPASMETRFETCNGRVEVAGLEGALACDAVNGGITVRDAAGPVKATTVNGSVRIEFRGALKASHLETVNGSVEVIFDRTSGLDYRLETVNGRIEGSNIDLDVEGKYGPREARGSWNGGGETLRCETINGSIRLRANDLASK